MEYWKDGFSKGKITVNGKDIDRNHRIKDGDHIVHKTTREETPVYPTIPDIILENSEYLVVNKPSSVPVHACGNFKFNTLQGILENELHYTKDQKGEVKTVHRLDRQTSGIVFFAKTETGSNRFRELMLSNKISKVYLARVRGDFSKCDGVKDGEIRVKNMIFCISNIDAFWVCCEEPELKFEYRTKAKEATTRFKFKFYDKKSNTSIVKCFPETGRTHQIRVHLKHLGFAIAND